MIGRQLEFARNMPPAKIAARLKLQLKRRILSRPTVARLAYALASDPPGLRLRAELPTPLFRHRGAVIRSSRDEITLRFLHHEENFGWPIDWHRPSLDHGTRLWLLNLHYMEWLADLDDENFARATLDWIAGTRRFERHYWLYSWNSYALSIRVVAWLKELAERRLDAALVDPLVRSISRQMRHLGRNLETDIGGNHLVKNIKALLWAAACFQGDPAERWRRLGTRLLERELDVQLLPDGMHYERSPSYHQQVFADLLECRHVLPESSLRTRLDAQLERMAVVIAELAHPDGGPALFNDAGLTMAPAAADCLAAFGGLGFAVPSPSEAFALPDGGYFGLRTSDGVFIADAGPVGPDDLPAHAHADVGSFELSVAGKRLIVDQGVFEYNSGSRRDDSRSTACHNTLSVDGADQAELFGSFRCGRRPRVTAEHRFDAEGFRLTVSHDGFAHLAGKPVHKRLFEVAADRITITDQVESGAAHRIAASLLLHPDAVVEIAGNAATVASGDGSIRIETGAELAIEAAVWWPDMGLELPTRRLRLTGRDGAADVRTVITILTGTAA